MSPGVPRSLGADRDSLLRGARIALIVLTALPVFAVLTYGWGVAFGAASGVSLALGIRWALRSTLSERPFRPVVLRAAVAIAPLEGAETIVRTFDGVFGRQGTTLPADEIALWAIMVCVLVAVGTVTLLVWLFPALNQLALVRDARQRPWPHEEADELTYAALSCVWVGAAAAVFADEPLWPLCALTVASGFTAVWWISREASSLRAWLDKVSAGEVGGWALRARESVDAEQAETCARAELVRRGAHPSTSSIAYRELEREVVVAPVHARWTGERWEVTLRGRPSDLARRVKLHVVAVIVCACLSLVTHGYGLPPSAERLPIGASRGLVESRVFIVNRAPPESVWSRVRRRKRLRRMGQVRVPGVELWRDCKEFHCKGLILALDERGRVLDTPDVMARVRHWALDRQVRLRLSLMASWPSIGDEPIRAIRCGERVWASLPDGPTRLDPATLTFYWFDFASGGWGDVRVPSSTPLDCRLQRLPDSSR